MRKQQNWEGGLLENVMSKDVQIDSTQSTSINVFGDLLLTKSCSGMRSLFAEAQGLLSSDS